MGRLADKGLQRAGGLDAGAVGVEAIAFQFALDTGLEGVV